MSGGAKKNRLYLILYSIALFSAAMAIVLLSYLYSSRMEGELEESRSISNSAMQSVADLIEENQVLNEQLNEMTRLYEELLQQTEGNND